LFRFSFRCICNGRSARRGQGGGPQAFIMNIAPLVLIFVIFYFLLIRPQQKKSKELKSMLDNVKKAIRL